MNIRETAPRITELEKISTRTDTRDYLAKAAPTKPLGFTAVNLDDDDQ